MKLASSQKENDFLYYLLNPFVKYKTNIQVLIIIIPEELKLGYT